MRSGKGVKKSSGWISSKLMNILTFTVVCKHPWLRHTNAVRASIVGPGQGITKAARHAVQATRPESLKHFH
jgi:hypothetical protein